MESTVGCRDALFRVERRRTADHHHVHRLMREELLEVRIGGAFVPLRQSRQFLFVRSIDGCNLKARVTRGADVRFGYVASTGKPNMEHVTNLKCSSHELLLDD